MGKLLDRLSPMRPFSNSLISQGNSRLMELATAKATKPPSSRAACAFARIKTSASNLLIGSSRVTSLEEPERLSLDWFPA